MSQSWKHVLAELMPMLSSMASPAVSAPSATNAQLYESCENGIAAACDTLGLRHIYGEGVEKDDHMAFTLFQKACAGKNAQGCFDLAVAYAKGVGVTANAAEVVKHTRTACMLGSPSGCNYLGRSYELGALAAPNKAEAAKYYKMACGGKDAEGCKNLAALTPAPAAIPKYATNEEVVAWLMGNNTKPAAQVPTANRPASPSPTAKPVAQTPQKASSASGAPYKYVPPSRAYDPNLIPMQFRGRWAEKSKSCSAAGAIVITWNSIDDRIIANYNPDIYEESLGFDTDEIDALGDPFEDHHSYVLSKSKNELTVEDVEHFTVYRKCP